MNNSDWLILNIDDNEAIRYAKTRALQRADFNVIEAGSGVEGLQCVSEQLPDLVMCDVKLPDMNGLDVCRRIKEEFPGTLVLQVSASFTTTKDRVAGLDFGADSYLTEPVEPEELVAAVRALLRMKKAEDQLRALNERLEQEVAERTLERDRIWRVSNELMAVASPDGYLKSINPAWTRLLGYSETQLLGRPYAEIIHADDVPAAEEIVRILLEGRSISQTEIRLIAADGAERCISWTATFEDNRIYALGRDVTEERQKQIELDAAEEKLRQSQKMEAVGQLTGGIAHDFNNLLTGIIGSLDVVGRRIKQGRMEGLDNFMDAASTSARRAAALTHRLLAFSRRQSLDFKAVDVNALVTAIYDLLRRTLGENIELVWSPNETLWDAVTDANQLETALLNLVINARDAMPQGGTLTVEATNTTLSEAKAASFENMNPGDYVHISVTDTGTGMDPDTVERAFEPFFTTKPIGEGTGLGLSMVYGFARQSHGHARIISAIGKGTSVELYLPRDSGRKVDAIPTKDRSEVVAKKGEVILVVEDDPAVRLLIVEVLEELGYKTLVTSNGTEAAKILQSDEKIDLLVSDLGLPGLNGRKVAEIARQTRPHIQVLFITGYAESAMVRSRGLGPGMSLITKPFDLDTLAAKIREMQAA